MAQQRLSDWLNELDSHVIYPASLLTEIPGVVTRFETVKGPAGGPVAILARADGQGAPVRLSLETLGAMAAHPGPAGVTLNPGHELTELSFAGFYLASRLAVLFIGTSPGAAKLGRGSAFRADVAGLAAAGL